MATEAMNPEMEALSAKAFIALMNVVLKHHSEEISAQYRDFGEHPKGVNTFDANGQFSIFSNRYAARPAENRIQ
jgi:hypothetical protein